MTEPIEPTATPPAPPSWSRSRILRALANPLRFRMLEAILARPEGFSIAEMAAHVRQKRSLTGKHLEQLRRTEIVVLNAAHADGREQVHILNPVLRPPPGEPFMFDFGFMVLRFETRAPAAAAGAVA